MTHPFRQLLLATEHSEYDSGAERIALELARRCNMPLAAVLPIASNPEYEAVAPELAARAEADAANRIQALHAQAIAAGVDLNSQVRRGAELDREIVAEAQAQGSDLIIARRRGKRGFLARLLVGEMVSRVLAHAPCSVLLVPRACALWSQGVLLALDPRVALPLQQPQIEAALGVASECALPLWLVCVSDGSATDQSQAKALIAHVLAAAQARQLRAEGEIRSGRPFDQIIAAADAHHADLLVLGRHGNALPGKAWLGGTTQKVIGLAERPVLVAIQKEKP